MNYELGRWGVGRWGVGRWEKKLKKVLSGGYI